MESVEYSEESMKKAKQWASKLKATGGTKIYDPLRNVLRLKEIEGHPRCIILLTDGEVSATDRVLHLAGEYKTPIFTLGVGESFSQELVEGLASTTDGQWLAVKNSSDISDKCIRLLRYCLAPTLVDLDIDLGPWKSNTIKQFPNKVPNLVVGKRSAIYFVKDLKGEPQQLPPFKVRFKGKYDNDETLDLSLPICLNVDAEGVSKEQQDRLRKTKTQLLHRIAAMSRIKFLEKEKRIQVNSKELESEILELGLKYNIATSKTSFIAVRENSEGVRISAKEQRLTAEKKRRFEAGYMSLPAMEDFGFGIGLGNTVNNYKYQSIQPQMYGAINNQFMQRQRSSQSEIQPMQCSSSIRQFSSTQQNLSFNLHQFDQSHSLPSRSWSAPVVNQSRLPERNQSKLSKLRSKKKSSSHVRRRQSNQIEKEENDIKNFSRHLESKESNNGGGKSSIKFTWLVRQQKFHGSFSINVEDSKFDFIRVGIEKLQSQVKNIELIATIVALVVLYQIFAEKKSEWMLIERKARDWLKKNTNENVDDLMKLF